MYLQSSGAMNASIFANDRITAYGGGGAIIEGFCYNNGGTGGDLSVICQPVYNPAALSTVQSQPAVNVPVFDAGAHAGIATQVINGNYRPEGTVQLGTRANPAILHVKGDLTVYDPVHFAGYGVLMVEGDVRIYDEITNDGMEETQLGIYTEGRVSFHDRGTFSAQVFANGSIAFYDTPHIYGSVTTRGKFSVTDPMTFTHRPASSVLTEPFWPSN